MAKAAGGKGGDAPAAAGEEVLVISVPVHCDGCGRKLRRSLQRLDGVGEVSVDSTSNRVVVRGPKVTENAAEAVRIVERRTGRKAVLVSPAPEKLPPPAAKKKGGEKTKKDGGNKGVTDELPEIDMYAPQNMVVVLRMNLHCDACCEEIKRRILRIKGVEDAVPHLKSSQMMVKGTVEPATLVGFIRNCTGRRAAIFRAEPLDPPPPPAPKSPPKDAPPAEAEPEKKNDSPSDDAGEKKEEKPQPPEESKGGEGDDDKGNPSGGGGGSGAEEHEEAHGGGEAAKDGGVVVENHKKDADRRLFTVPLPAGVVTAVAPPEMMAVNSVNPYCNYYPPYPYGHPYQYQYPQPWPPAYACGGAASMYGYPQEAFCEENPNACAIV